MGQLINTLATLTNDLLRIAVGTVQIYLASHAISESGVLKSLLSHANSSTLAFVVSHATLPVMFAGGVMLVSGFLTRIAAAVQLPIVAAGALFYIFADFPQAEYGALGLSPILFLALLNIIVSGPSKISVDYLSGLEDGNIFPEDPEITKMNEVLPKEETDEDPIECARRLAW
ncbi:MAG: hypothetical protein RI932_1572 [Pseudomonadota bacterium]|jgi:putative oxidoreductase